VLSSAIACHLAAGSALPDAVSAAKAYLGAKLRAALAPGRGAHTLV
jgi:hydroxymethylpyrimidine/phosphomethylpyrimidine kinase